MNGHFLKFHSGLMLTKVIMVVILNQPMVKIVLLGLAQMIRMIFLVPMLFIWTLLACVFFLHEFMTNPSAKINTGKNTPWWYWVLGAPVLALAWVFGKVSVLWSR